MLYAGCDLHKQTITVCVVNQSRQIVHRQRLLCADESTVRSFFAELGEFEAVVEATASYEWFVKLIEPSARRVLLAHPKKLGVIAESTRKSDQLDAQRRLTSVKNRIRRMLANYNADRARLFNAEGLAYLRSVALSDADRFSMDQFLEEYDFGQGQLKAAEQRLQSFAETGPIREREQRELLRSIPGVGFVTAEIVLAELADIERFRSQKDVVAYAGLSPGQRESAGKSKELHLEKTGSKLLRWAVVEAAWRLVRHAARWRGVYEKLKVRVRAKKAIIAVARRLLTMMAAILQSGQPDSTTYVPGQTAA